MSIKVDLYFLSEPLSLGGVENKSLNNRTLNCPYSMSQDRHCQETVVTVYIERTSHLPLTQNYLAHSLSHPCKGQYAKICGLSSTGTVAYSANAPRLKAAAHHLQTVARQSLHHCARTALQEKSSRPPQPICGSSNKT